MDKLYGLEELYVAFPSIINEKEFYQNPNNVMILKEENGYDLIDIFTGEEVYIFKRDELKIDKKYIGVFSFDCQKLLGYIYSFNTEHVNDIETLSKFMFKNGKKYSIEELNQLLIFFKQEVPKIAYKKIKRISKKRGK